MQKSTAIEIDNRHAKSNSPAVLVGHSFGGIVISAAAEKAPSKVKTLVFLAAYLPGLAKAIENTAQ